MCEGEARSEVREVTEGALGTPGKVSVGTTELHFNLYAIWSHRLR